MPNTEITQDVLLELKKEESEKSMNVLRVVSWNKQKAKVEKRAFYRTATDSEMKMGKVLGLNTEDIKVIVEKKDQILKLME